MNLKKLFSYSTLLMSTVSSAFAQCVVGGTDFDTNTDLCCPILSSDSEEGGWYNEDLDLSKICKAEMFVGLENANQSGITGILSTLSSNDMSGIDEVFHQMKAADYGKNNEQFGYSTITAQPKLAHPFFMANETANNMFVNIGSASNCHFLSYTVRGLEPGSNVELSFTLYNLMDAAYFEHLAKDVCKGNNAQLSEFITNYTYSRTGAINGNALRIGVVSSDDNVKFNTMYNNSLMLSYCKNITSAAPTFGETAVVTHKAKVPESGNITFYFYRSSDCFQIPVGIDNIEIVGSIKPVITYTGNPCPQQPIRVSTKQNYPEGTKFSWKESVTGQTSTDANFIFIPTEPDTDYKVTCEVTLPGCTPAKSDPLTIHSGVCCTTADGAPMAMTNLFYDDFGNFISDDTYEWTDRYGVTHTEIIPAGHTQHAQSLGVDANIPCVRAYNIESSGATLRMPYLKDIYIDNQLYDHGMYAVSAHGGYPGGVQNDNSGTTTGGMLQFDLLDDGSQDDFFEVDIEHICTGKEVSFGADFASISAHPGCIEVQLLYGDKVLAEESKSFTGGLDGWKSVNKTFTIGAQEVGGESEATVTMKIRHNNECLKGLSNYRGETRDYAIDNIFFSVCTPPDVNVESSVSTGKELYDLCVEDVLKLTAISSDAVKRFYLTSPTSKVGYVYQYTFQDPSTANEINKIKWTTIHKEEVIESESFDIEIKKYWDDIFSKMSSDDRIYFRVVVGEYSDLIADQSWKTTSAFSPCRKVSISNIPVVAGVKCATCTTPDPVEFSAEGGKFNAAKKTVELSAGDSVVIGMANPVHGIDQDGNDYNDYAVKWYKNSLKSTYFLAKKCSKGKDVAPKFTVKYDDVKAAGATGVKYIINIHDNFDPSSATTPCDIYDTITVIGLVSDPEPVKEENVVYLFYDDFGNFVSDDTYEWTDITGEKHTETIPAGQVHTSQSHGYDIKIPYVKAYNLEASGATLNIPLVGGDKPELYYFGVYVVSKFGSYPGGVKFDNSGTETGGMLQFDLLDDGSQDDFFEMNLENICYGKEISFGADIASFSSWPSHIEILLERNGNTIASADAIVEGSIGWKTINATTVINPDDSNSPIKLKIRYLGGGSMGGGDIAIDNIFVSTTVPPVLTLESSVSASDTLSLCKGDLTMTAKISQSDNISYENLNYLFQYTYTDPSSTDAEKIKWEDLGGILEINSVSISIISPLYQDVFELLKEDEPGNIYFRVVAGEKEDLLAKDLWADNTALSPCRIVSISSNVLVAGLQCENSSSAQVDANNEVSFYPNPASTNITVVADGVVEKVEILNTVGEVVKVSDSKDINIADLHNGVYFVRATIDDETSVHKLVINK